MVSRKKVKSKKEIPFWVYFEKNISPKKLKTLLMVAVLGIGLGILYSRSGGSLSADQIISGSKSCIGKSCQSPSWQDKIRLTNEDITANIPANCRVNLQFREEVLSYFKNSSQIKADDKISRQYNKMISNLSKMKPAIVLDDQKILTSQSASTVEKQQIVEKYYNPLLSVAAKDFVAFSAKKSDQIFDYYQKAVFKKASNSQTSLNQTPPLAIESFSGSKSKVVKANSGQYMKIAILSISDKINQDDLTVGYIQDCKPNPSRSMIKGTINSIITIKYQVTPMTKNNLGQYQKINPDNQMPIIAYQIDKNSPDYIDSLSKPFFTQF